MKKMSVLVSALVLCLAGPVMACDKHGKSASVTLAGAKKGCCPTALKGAVAKAMKDMPAMTYRAGKTETPCFKTATAKAGCESKVKYVVAGKTFDDKATATMALAEMLEQKADALQQVSFAVGDKTYHCPMSAKAASKGKEKVQYQLAGFNFDSKEQVDAVMNMIQTTLTGTTGSKPCCPDGCPKDCCKGAIKTAGAKKAPCNKGLQTAGAKKAPCNKGLQTAGAEKAPCNKSKAAAQVAGATKAKKGGCGSKAKAGATVVKSDKPCCPKEAEARLAAAQSKIQVIVEAAAAASLSS